jgi:membrane-bound lytic murein transglycosylase B
MLNKIILSLCLSFITWFYSCTVLANKDFVARPDVQNFIQHMAAKHNFNAEELNTLFNSVKVRPLVIQSIKAPLEIQPWYSYRNVFITESHIRQGLEFWDRHAEDLARAEKIYGVPASIIVATIGVETKYGKNKGEYRVIDALSTIAFSTSSRASYFLKELESFLLLSREQHLNPLTIKGSYAGAIGQPQFMPSSYREYAVNFSGNPTIDLSNNISDVIGSIANYYNKHGWLTNQPVAVPTVISDSDYQLLAKQNKLQQIIPQAELANYGITLHNNNVTANQKIKIIELQSYHGKEYWLSFRNFDVIKRYNPSNLYAMAVYQLSFYIAAQKERS